MAHTSSETAISVAVYNRLAEDTRRIQYEDTHQRQPPHRPSIVHRSPRPDLLHRSSVHSLSQGSHLLLVGHVVRGRRYG